MLLYPIDNQFAHFFAGAIHDGSAFVHCVVAAAVDSIVIRHDAELLGRRQRLAFEFQILNPLSERLGEIYVIGRLPPCQSCSRERADRLTRRGFFPARIRENTVRNAPEPPAAAGRSAPK